MTLLTQQLRSNASVAVSLAVQQLPEFGVNASSIRLVLINSTTVDPIATANGTAYLISIQMAVVLVGPRSDRDGLNQDVTLVCSSHTLSVCCRAPFRPSLLRASLQQEKAAADGPCSFSTAVQHWRSPRYRRRSLSAHQGP